MATVTISSSHMQVMERRYRSNLINSVSGFKSASLIGTADKTGKTNLAIFNSVVHIGANPPLLGFVLRPTDVPRHTFSNIRESGNYTINHINRDCYREAHNTSAKFPEGVSEFDACGLTAVYTESFPAPYVGESHIRIGMEFIEDHLIQANHTVLVVGKIVEINLPEECLGSDGYVDLVKAGTLAISGLDTYLAAKRLERLGYVRPDDITKNK